MPPSHEVVGFNVYCPKALAGLNKLPGTLTHRSIPIGLKPPRPGDAYEDFDPEEAAPQAELLTINLQTWAAGAAEMLGDPGLKPVKLPELDARGNEIWRILFRIADIAGRDWPDRARHAAVTLSGTNNRRDEASTGVQLLGHIHELFDGERMTCRAVVEALNSAELLAYGGWNDGTGISTRELGRKLAQYGITAKPIRVNGERAGNGYDRDQFEDPWSRYLPTDDPPHQYTGTTRTTEPNHAAIQPVQAPLGPVREGGANTHEQSDVPLVPLSYGVTGRDGRDDDGALPAGRIPAHPLPTPTPDTAPVIAGPALTRPTETPTAAATASPPRGKLIGTCVRCGAGVGDDEWTFAAWDGKDWRVSGRTLPGAGRLAARGPLLCPGCAIRLKHKLISPPAPLGSVRGALDSNESRAPHHQEMSARGRQGGVMAGVSLERCDRCEFTTGDVALSRRDRVPRCPPCERRADHERRLAAGDAWYRERIAEWAGSRYGPGWERDLGFDHCAAVFVDTRALCGWAGVGVEVPRRTHRWEIVERPCPVCGETTTSVSGYVCAGCHFRGWWGRWRSGAQFEEPPAA